MREPAHARVPSGMGTQAVNHNSNEPVQINKETNQNTPNYMEMIQANQYNINVTNINPTPIKPNTNSFYNSWGDLPNPKPANMVHLALQNFGGWPQWNKNQKNETIQQYLNKKNIDIFIIMENNMAWHQIPLAQCLPECMQGWWEVIHISIRYSRKD